MWNTDSSNTQIKSTKLGSQIGIVIYILQLVTDSRYDQVVGGGVFFSWGNKLFEAVPPGFAFSPLTAKKKAKDSGGGTPEYQDGVQFPAVSCFLLAVI